MGKKNVYPEEVVDYVREHCRKFTKPELVVLLKRDLNFDTDKGYIKLLMRKYGLLSGLNCQFKKGFAPANKGKRMPQDVYEKSAPTMFKKGNVPPNHKEVGALSEGKDGYLLIKVKEGTPGHNLRRDLWRPLHRIKWEEYHNQKIPEGMVVIFADGNKRNFDKDNLLLATKGEMAIMNHERKLSNNGDVTKVNLLITKIRIRTRELEKGKEGTNG